jgi:DnaJ family protein C protein 3
VGRAEGLAKKEEWEEAARVLEKVFEESGRHRRDVGLIFFLVLRCCY